MKKLIIALLLVTGSNIALADQYVRGYTKRDGTYVAPHHRSESNNHRYDNCSSQGNINPYTGQRGQERNEFSGYSNPPQGNSYGTNPYGSYNQNSYC